jgi:hypothetical protein
LFRLGAGTIAMLTVAFVSTGAISAALSGSYLTIPWHIRSCNLMPPESGLILADCADVSTKFYYSGSIYLGIEKPLIESLAKADVVIIGNSRTQLSFASKAVDRYFQRKGLRYFILGSEGSGFRFNMLMLERLNIRPKVLLVNNEIYFVDVLSDANKSVVLDPERFAPMMSVFYHTKKIVQPICTGAATPLRDFYCSGDGKSNWRNPETGALYIDYKSYEKSGLKRIPVKDVPETRIHYFDLFMKNAKAFLASPSISGSCRINYIVPSLDSSVDLARKMAQAMNTPFIFPPIRDYFSFDGSHLWPESSERWSAEFLELADPFIDRCLRANGHS